MRKIEFKQAQKSLYKTSCTNFTNSRNLKLAAINTRHLTRYLFKLTYKQKNCFHCSCSTALKTSPVFCSPGKKPELKLDTKPFDTENKGLKAELEWRKKAGVCEHTEVSKFVHAKNDPVVECDVIADSEEEKGKSIKEKVIQPSKHTATEKEGDKAFLCNDCQIIIC